MLHLGVGRRAMHGTEPGKHHIHLTISQLLIRIRCWGGDTHLHESLKKPLYFHTVCIPKRILNVLSEGNVVQSQ